MSPTTGTCCYGSPAKSAILFNFNNLQRGKLDKNRHISMNKNE
jgi:hypothetical protein